MLAPARNERGTIPGRHDQREAPAALDHLRYLLAFNQALQRRQNLRGRHAVLRGRRIVDATLIWAPAPLLDFQICDAGDTGQPTAQGVGLTA